MAKLVKITVSDEGIEYVHPKWCVVVYAAATERTLCGGEAFGVGDSAAKFVEKTTGKVTCPECIEMLTKSKQYKF